MHCLCKMYSSQEINGNVMIWTITILSYSGFNLYSRYVYKDKGYKLLVGSKDCDVLFDGKGK
jgi:hypothetical protein